MKPQEPIEMRKLIFAINISLDGCCEHTKFFPDEDTMQYFTSLTLSADTFLYGRKTYELMVPFWPEMARNTRQDGDRDVDIEFARAFDAVDKIVVISQSLSGVENEKTTVVGNDIYNEVVKLKNASGKNILTGGIDIPSQLAALGLVDEYHFAVHPIIAGEGRRLLEASDLKEKLKLKPIDVINLNSGCIVLRYAKE